MPVHSAHIEIEILSMGRKLSDDDDDDDGLERWVENQHSCIKRKANMPCVVT